ncbi:uncharacterized protein BHQ10_010389 [Talaromyces amestolkiae]|uniref:Secreted protein n=1 Tax=Talaromyces amestolkiae TaxID=1196081 RepID=A0A364LF05_TALAM|nr:uncharacterized protein BHQ10_010389 [Talaromyces amestolkiae]RAO74377.1 hypothetical protein BHQ10_010389 [Talaromyces amestolkiae]
MLIHLAFVALLKVSRLIVDLARVLLSVDHESTDDGEIGSPFVVEHDDEPSHIRDVEGQMGEDGGVL